MREVITMFAVVSLILSVFLVGCGLTGEKDDEGGVTPGLPPPGHHEFPRWSPDGQTILYYSHGLILYDPQTNRSIIDSDSMGIWAMDANGTNHRKLLSAGYADWGPDGEWIVFTGGGQIYKIRFNGQTVDTSSITQLTFEGSNFFPNWSPDGQWIAYDSNVDSPNGLNFIWKMKADGSEKIRIAHTPEEGETRMPSWSQVGQKIIHIRFLVGVFSSEIYSMNSDGSGAARLTENEATDRYPKFSPDSTAIAFESDVQVWVMNVDGSNLIQLTFGELGRMPDWSPNGEEIVYVGPKGTIWIMNKDGENHLQLTYRPEGVIKN